MAEIRWRGLATGRARAWAVALFAWTVVGCRQTTSTITGIRLKSTWDEGALAVYQLEFSIQDADANAIVMAERRPALPERPLPSGTSVMVYLPDELGGTEIPCGVKAYKGSVLVAAGTKSVQLVQGAIVDAEVVLQSLLACKTRCSSGTCSGGFITGVEVCNNATGACEPGPDIICAPFACATSAGEPYCLTRCSSLDDCIVGQRCEDGSCGRKFPGAACTSAAECIGNLCEDGVCCETECRGACQSCNQVGAQGTCTLVRAGGKDPHGRCPTEDPSTCGRTGACDGSGGCALHAEGAICEAAVCTSTDSALLTTARKCDGRGACQPSTQQACSPYACAAGACRDSCEKPSDCSTDGICDMVTGSCGLKGPGQKCKDGTQCKSGFCADGVCCNEACTQACRSCSIGQAGTCSMVSAGASDPHGVCVDKGEPSCATDGKCDGMGGCRKYAAGTVCVAGSCSKATNTRTLPKTCDGAGNCASIGPPVSCAPYRCNGAACYPACTNDNQCVAPNRCIAGICGTLLSLGSSCLTNGQCESNHCTENVCCDAADCGACRSCTVSGFAGFCRPLPAGTPEPRSMCPGTAPSSCGWDGTCDGAGACRYWSAGTQCSGASCNGRYLDHPWTCNGAGACSSNGSADCSPYQCDSATTSCRTSCQSSSHCCCGTSCKGGTCR